VKCQNKKSGEFDKSVLFHFVWARHVSKKIKGGQIFRKAATPANPG